MLPGTPKYPWDSAASPASVIGPMLIVAVLGLLVLIPSLWFLFSIFKRHGGPTRNNTMAGSVGHCGPCMRDRLPFDGDGTSPLA